MKINNLSILHGFSSGAGQPYQISNAQRELGALSTSMHIGPNKLSYNFHEIVPQLSTLQRSKYLKDIEKKYNTFHFYGFPLFGWKNELNSLTGLDLLYLSLAKKAVVMNFRGSEVRQKDLFEKYTAFAFNEGEDHGLFKSFPAEEQRQYIEICRELGAEISVPDAELASYVPGSKIIPRAMNLNDWEYIGPCNKSKPLIVHAPTRRHVKGTDYIINSIQTLKNEGLEFDFLLVEGFTNSEAREIYKKSDIIVDQLKIGWHGVLSLESMALGKCTICYIREDLEHSISYNGQLPLVNANQNNLTDKLRALISSAPTREKIGRLARDYVCATHDTNIVAKQFIDLYLKAHEKIKDGFTPRHEVIEKLIHLNIRNQTKFNETISKLSKKIISKSQTTEFKKAKQITKPSVENSAPTQKSEDFAKNLPCLTSELHIQENFRVHEPSKLKKYEFIKLFEEITRESKPIKSYIDFENELKTYLRKNLEILKRPASSNFISDFRLWAVKAIQTINKIPEDHTKFTHYLTEKSRVKIAIITCLWGRNHLTEKFLHYYSDLKSKLNEVIDLKIIAIHSEKNIYPITGVDVEFHYHKNTPISDKWQFALNKAKETNVDAVITLGSDDFLQSDIFILYEKLLKQNVLMCGFTDFYFSKIDSLDQLHYWEGYGYSFDLKNQPHRICETVGAGRMYSRLLLEKLQFKLWEDLDLNKGLDSAASRTVSNFGILPIEMKYQDINDILSGKTQSPNAQIGMRLSDLAMFAVDIKSIDENITPLENYIESIKKDHEINSKSKDLWKNLIKTLKKP